MNVRNRINTQTMLPPRVSIEIGIIVSVAWSYYCLTRLEFLREKNNI